MEETLPVQSDQHHGASPHDDASVERVLKATRARAESLLRGEHERIEAAESALNQYLQDLLEEIVQQQARGESSETDQQAALQKERAELESLREQIERRQSQLQQQNEQLEQQHADLQRQRSEWETQRAQMDQQRTEWETSRQQHEQQQQQLVHDLKQQVQQWDQQRSSMEDERLQLAQLQQTLRETEAALQEQRGQLESTRAELDERSRKLDAQVADVHQRQEQLKQQEERTRQQRLAVARQLRTRRAELLADIERQGIATGESEDSFGKQLQRLLERDDQWERFQTNLDELARQLQDRSAELSSVQQQLQQERETWQQRADAWEEERKQLEASAAVAGDGDDQASLEEMKQVVAQLRDQLEEAEKVSETRGELLRQLEASESAAVEPTAELLRVQAERDQLASRLEAMESEQPGHDQEAMDDLRQRFELAVEEIRELKAENAQLRQQLESNQPSITLSEGNDWESQKRRMLALLETDGEEQAPAERLSIENAIEMTDKTIAEKERQIEQLRRQIEQQAEQLATSTNIPSEIAEALDQDELIAQEREKLQQLQTEWREKLRQAEVDISLERAKLARERTELEERLHHYKQQLERTQSSSSTPEMEEEKPARGRWLARLGLSRDEQ